jgi:hypothetical protein
MDPHHSRLFFQQRLLPEKKHPIKTGDTLILARSEFIVVQRKVPPLQLARKQTASHREEAAPFAFRFFMFDQYSGAITLVLTPPTHTHLRSECVTSAWCVPVPDSLPVN